MVFGIRCCVDRLGASGLAVEDDGRADAPVGRRGQASPRDLTEYVAIFDYEHCCAPLPSFAACTIAPNGLPPLPGPCIVPYPPPARAAPSLSAWRHWAGVSLSIMHPFPGAESLLPPRSAGNRASRAYRADCEDRVRVDHTPGRHRDYRAGHQHRSRLPGSCRGECGQCGHVGFRWRQCSRQMPSLRLRSLGGKTAILSRKKRNPGGAASPLYRERRAVLLSHLTLVAHTRSIGML